MKAPPALRVTIERFGPWCAASAVLGAASMACALEAAWAWTSGAHAPPLALLLIAAGSGAALGTWRARLPAQRLGWNGRDWELAELASTPSPRTGSAAETLSGSVRLMIDLGSWMLLRFDPEPAPRVRRRWLPVQRKGIEPAWHGLRCALIYSAASSSRPVPDPRPQ